MYMGRPTPQQFKLLQALSMTLQTLSFGDPHISSKGGPIYRSP
uniref:Uncharacterized protein n=1 Tax=Rhizophora mucronata TaxID=61149 RepID=A0A2P2PB56_RHIMU